jgi:hypothetical protein
MRPVKKTKAAPEANDRYGCPEGFLTKFASSDLRVLCPFLVLLFVTTPFVVYQKVFYKNKSVSKFFIRIDRYE